VFCALAEDDGIWMGCGLHSEHILLEGLEFVFLRLMSTLRLVMDSLFWQSTHLQF
jgi:hypothetical protein